MVIQYSLSCVSSSDSCKINENKAYIYKIFSRTSTASSLENLRIQGIFWLVIAIKTSNSLNLILIHRGGALKLLCDTNANGIYNVSV